MELCRGILTLTDQQEAVPPPGPHLGLPAGTPRIPPPSPCHRRQDWCIAGRSKWPHTGAFLFSRIRGEEIAFVFFFPSWLNMPSDLQTWKTTRLAVWEIRQDNSPGYYLMEWGKPSLSFLLKFVAIIRKKQLSNSPPALMGLPGHCNFYLISLLILQCNTSLCLVASY